LRVLAIDEIGYLSYDNNAADLAIVLVHHLRKNVSVCQPGQALRGSGGLHEFYKNLKTECVELLHFNRPNSAHNGNSKSTPAAHKGYISKRVILPNV
jgi:hypothetical protein